MISLDNIFITTTDTVIGIGGPISNVVYEGIFSYKKRSKGKHLIIMVGSIEQARKFEGWNDKAEELAKKYWPGAVTLAVNENLALRIPNKDGLRELLNEVGPVYMTSANISGQPPVKSIEEAKRSISSSEEFLRFWSW